MFLTFVSSVYIHRALYVPHNCLAATVCFLFSGFGTLIQLCTLSRKLGEACSLWTWKRLGVSSYSVPCGSVYRAHKGTRLVHWGRRTLSDLLFVTYSVHRSYGQNFLAVPRKCVHKTLESFPVWWPQDGSQRAASLLLHDKRSQLKNKIVHRTFKRLCGLLLG